MGFFKGSNKGSIEVLYVFLGVLKGVPTSTCRLAAALGLQGFRRSVLTGLYRGL